MSREDFFRESLFLQLHLGGQGHAAEEGRLGGTQAKELLPDKTRAGGGGCQEHSGDTQDGEASGDGEMEFHSRG
jgi:hypothetical protein